MENKQKIDISRDRRLLMTPNYWNGISETHPKMIQYHGINLKIYFNLFENGRMTAYYYEHLWNQAAEHIAKKIYGDKQYLMTTRQRMKKLNKKLKN